MKNSYKSTVFILAFLVFVTALSWSQQNHQILIPVTVTVTVHSKSDADVARLSVKEVLADSGKTHLKTVAWEPVKHHSVVILVDDSLSGAVTNKLQDLREFI